MRYKWQISLLAVVVAVLVSTGDSAPRMRRAKTAITTTVRELLRVIVEGLKGLYRRVFNLDVRLSKLVRNHNHLKTFVFGIHSWLNLTAEKVDRNKVWTESKIANMQQSLGKKITDSKEHLLNLINKQSIHFKNEIALVKLAIEKEQKWLAHLQTEFAEGTFKINRTINGINTPLDGSVRIVGGGTSGRVQMHYFGQWTLICDDEWTERDAIVVCRMLGHKNVAPVAYKEELHTDVLIDQVVCLGHETTLGQCPHLGWTSHKCVSKQIAAVNCRPSTVIQKPTAPLSVIAVGQTRLVGGGNKTVGRLEVLHANKWGTVCDDDWTEQNSIVVCRSLGLAHGNTEFHDSVMYSFLSLVNANTRIWLDGVACSGNETDVSQCTHQAYGITDCDHTENVGIKCS